MEYYFAYGSNMNEKRMLHRGMQYSDPISGKLPGYRLMFNKQARDNPDIAYANIAYDPASHVEGVLYKLSNSDEIRKMDPYEGVPVRYSRELFSIETASVAITAWVYVGNPGVINNQLSPAAWYLAHLLAGKNFLSAPYYQRLAATKTHEMQQSVPS